MHRKMVMILLPRMFTLRWLTRTVRKIGRISLYVTDEDIVVWDVKFSRIEGNGWTFSHIHVLYCKAIES